MLRWCLVGAPPFPIGSSGFIEFLTAPGPQPLSRIRAGISAATDELVSRCLARDPAARPADASELLDALVRCRTALRD